MTETTTGLDKIGNVIERVADALSAAATEHGPEAVAVALSAVRVHAASSLVYGALAAIIAVAGIRYMPKAIATYKAKRNDERAYQRDEEVPWIFAIGGLGVAITFCAIVTVATLADIWTYAAIIDPRLYIARKALGF